VIVVFDIGVMWLVYVYFVLVFVDDDGIDIDELDEDGNSYFDIEVGYGMFICGLV